MFKGVKIATSPTRVKTITNQSEQLQHWVEHYLGLYSNQNIVKDAALNTLPSLTVMEELDNPPTLEDLSKTIDCLTCSKALGKDGRVPDSSFCMVAFRASISNFILARLKYYLPGQISSFN